MCDDCSFSEYLRRWMAFTGYLLWIMATAGYALSGVHNTPVSCELIPMPVRVLLGAIAVALAVWGPWYLHNN